MLGITPNMFYRWQQELFDNAAAAFEFQGRGRPADSLSKKLGEENVKLRERLVHKDMSSQGSRRTTSS